MKHLLFVIVLTCLTDTTFSQSINGAWKRNLDTAVQYLTIIDDYFSTATFHVADKKFISTRGGTATIANNKMSGVIEFNTANKNEVKSTYAYDLKAKAKKLQLPVDGITKEWERVDDGSDALSGNWKITGREQDGKMVAMRPGARKTIKILSGTRFQWAAINSETGEFFGTGGGDYTFKDGKYTENIEFFSRDASRVGASLSFDAALKEGKWHHSGLSSKGDKIYEIWERGK
ncbi:MAG: membrane or secreted protein [Chitinophagia bacterium]|jgi:hypothetical protein